MPFKIAAIAIAFYAPPSNAMNGILRLGPAPVPSSSNNPFLRAGRRRLEGVVECNFTGFQDCSGNPASYNIGQQLNQYPGDCIENWDRGVHQYYPYDFQGITNFVNEYTCRRSNKRIFLSNGIPDHTAVQVTEGNPCEKFWHVEVPLRPTYVDSSQIMEPSPSGIVAMHTNGVPIFGALEANGGNAVEPTSNGVKDAKFWYGHATVTGNVEHYHNPSPGEAFITSETLLGFALDGFPIYGPLDDESVLDECNGVAPNGDFGDYRYHVRKLDQVSSEGDGVCYCNGTSPVVNWKYIVGCFHGALNETVVQAWDGAGIRNLNVRQQDRRIDRLGIVPGDCRKLDREEAEEEGRGGRRKRRRRRRNQPDERPNIIIMQPDDLLFYDIWSRPPNNPTECDKNLAFPNNFLMPNIERLRKNGVQMMSAYAASPACGTSRYSTITGKYPSRSAYSRLVRNVGEGVADVTIPKTKLQDIDDNLECSEENIAAVFQANGYRTGVTGKWHLAQVDYDTYNYTQATEDIKACGFDFAEGIYMENLVDDLTQDKNISHNMEWITAEAIRFIKGEYDMDDDVVTTDGCTSRRCRRQRRNGPNIFEEDDDEPFLLYFNPTAPHRSGRIQQALDIDCKKTADFDNWLTEDPMIKGMTLEYGSCEEYRKTVRRRAGSGAEDNDDYGPVWVDDAVGALIQALIDTGKFENTVFLFQMDHGVEAKNALYEGGSRIAQFVHYPNEFGMAGFEFKSPVSTIDIVPTMLDFAGIEDYYNLDGMSWRNAVLEKIKGTQPAIATEVFDQRCLLFEYERDRALRCGCQKFMNVRPNTATSTTYEIGLDFNYSAASEMLFDLCDANDNLITYDGTCMANPEETNILDISQSPNADSRAIKAALTCFIRNTRPSAVPINYNMTEECTGLFLDDSCSDRNNFRDNAGVQRNCTWESLDCAQYNDFCPETCGLCSER